MPARFVGLCHSREGSWKHSRQVTFVGDSGFRKDTCQPSLGQLPRCSIFMGGSNMQALQAHQGKGVGPGLTPGTVGGCGSRL